MLSTAGKPSCNFQGLVVDLLVVDTHRHKPDPFCLFSGEVIVQEEVVFGLGKSAEQRPNHGRMIAGGDAELHVPVDDRRLPSPTGSETTTNTIGIALVSRWSAAVTGMLDAKITSGRRPTNSFANIRIRSILPAAQRTSMHRDKKDK